MFPGHSKIENLDDIFPTKEEVSNYLKNKYQKLTHPHEEDEYFK